MTGSETALNPSFRSRAALSAASSRARKSATLAAGPRIFMACIMGTAAGPARRRLPIWRAELYPVGLSSASRDRILVGQSPRHSRPRRGGRLARARIPDRTSTDCARSRCSAWSPSTPIGRSFRAASPGVDVFFVISGFLISRIILSECAVGHFSLPAFYAKRAKRILPALLVVVSAVWIIGWFRAAPVQFRDIGGGLLGNSYFTVNFWLMRLAGVGGYFGADSAAKPLLHLWSLSIEEQFYLVWSVLLLAVVQAERPRCCRSSFSAYFSPRSPIASF